LVKAILKLHQRLKIDAIRLQFLEGFEQNISNAATVDNEMS